MASRAFIRPQIWSSLVALSLSAGLAGCGAPHDVEKDRQTLAASKASITALQDEVASLRRQLTAMADQSKSDSKAIHEQMSQLKDDLSKTKATFVDDTQARKGRAQADGKAERAKAIAEAVRSFEQIENRLSVGINSDDYSRMIASATERVQEAKSALHTIILYLATGDQLKSAVEVEQLLDEVLTMHSILARGWVKARSLGSTDMRNPEEIQQAFPETYNIPGIRKNPSTNDLSVYWREISRKLERLREAARSVR